MVSLPALAGGQVRAFVPSQQPVPMKNRVSAPKSKVSRQNSLPAAPRAEMRRGLHREAQNRQPDPNSP
jgi:hypothetical protein